MNSTTSRGLAVGLLAAALASVIGPTAAQAAAPKWRAERGIVIECQGDEHGVQVWTSVYENQRFGNTVQVVVGDPEDGNGSQRSTDEKFLVDGSVKASLQVGGQRAVILGTAERFGARTKVYEQFDDAGFLVKTRGFHRQLRTDLVAKYAGATVPLTCEPAFYYDLEVKKIPVA
jgi:hypothetical protein